MKKKYYITTPIYYPSNKLHLGHTYTTVAADTLARYKRLNGYEVFFLTGTDEHGQKIAERAAQEGLKPKEYVDGIVEWIKDLWKQYNISYDHFIRTTDKEHYKGAQEIFRRLKEKGDIYKDKYSGWYCIPCETFWPERQLEEGLCPDCQREVEWTEEESYFFKLSKYSDLLLAHIEKNPSFIQPESRKNEMVNFIKKGLDDLCVSRTSFSWGIPVLEDADHVIYVWIDALANYLTALGFPENEENVGRFWPADLHLVGKEIMRFHTIIWPCLLMALELPLPKQIFGHGWLKMEQVKMSKSLGNVIDPIKLANEFGVDAIRYYLLRELVFGQDGSYSLPSLLKRINFDLANDLGNLLHRSLNMVQQYLQGEIPQAGTYETIDKDLQARAQEAIISLESNLEKLSFSQSLEDLWQLVRRSNKYIDETSPWILAKDESKRERLETVLYNLLEVCRIIALALRPFLPETAKKMWYQLGYDRPLHEIAWSESFIWSLTTERSKIRLGEPIFPRLDLKTYEDWGKSSGKDLEGSKGNKEEKKEKKGNISFADFKRLDLIVAEVLKAEKIEGSDKLLKLVVSLGGEEKRQVVAGLALHYQAEELLGKKVVFLANLEPAKIFGVKSEGMVLAASHGERLEILTSPNLEAGSTIS